MTNEELLREAVQIADAKSMKLGTTAHVKALVALAREQDRALRMMFSPSDGVPCTCSACCNRARAALARAEVLR